MFDCIIVGAGPAGSAAGYHLAKRGRSVLILEKASLPRRKPCGGGVSPAIQAWFDIDFTPVVEVNVLKIRYTWKLEDPVETEVTTPMWMVQRDVFDQYLVEQAQKQGAELKDGTEVTGIQFQSDHWQVKTPGEVFQGRYLIGADGAKGPMAQWLGFKARKQRQGLVLESHHVPDQAAAFELGLVKNGSIWCFPKANGTSISATTFIGGESKSLSKDLVNYASQFGYGSDSPMDEHPLCLWDGDQKLHTQNAVIVGEAASLVDPLLAEGIRPAIFSGVKAAEAIDGALGGVADALETYTRVIIEQWGEDFMWAGRLAGAFYRFPGIGYKAFVKFPTATKMMAKILCGKLRYGDVANRAIKRLKPF